ncbi:MAG: ammonium transporter [Alphaproteobacteria bacterium]|nr:ammonium transporter [Alphaproteobacteria bacterium]
MQHKLRSKIGLAAVAALAFTPLQAFAQTAAATPINSGDTAWMLTATALVLMMTIPALALFYGGLVRKQNALATTMQSFATCSLVAVIWVIVGYSLSFTNGSITLPDGSTFIGDISKLFFAGVDHTVAFVLGAGLDNAVKTTIPEPLYMIFQMTFAIIAPALIAGAFADRIKFSALLVFMGVWSIFVYAPIAHWVWAPSGWLFKMGALDYAGGTVVHINAGVAGLIAAIMIGRRNASTSAHAPYNIIFSLIGASLLWVGWIGFNAGSALAADGRAAMAAAVTIVAAATAAVSWMAVEWADRGRPSISGKITGAVAGLVGITPASGFVDITGAIAIGFITGVLCYIFATRLKTVFKYDDSLDCFGVHGVGGIIGAILTGIFASKAIGGTEGSMDQVLIQLAAVGATIAWCSIVSFIILKIIDVTIGLRVDAETEQRGLDEMLHGEQIH